MHLYTCSLLLKFEIWGRSLFFRNLGYVPKFQKIMEKTCKKRFLPLDCAYKI